MRSNNALKDARPVIHLVEQLKAACSLSIISYPRPLPLNAQAQLAGPTYQLPFGEKAVSHAQIFDVQADNPVFLRPADIERLYGIPASTVYDWISDQAVTHFPAVKLAVKDEGKRRLVLVPKRLLDNWLADRSNLIKGE